MSDATVPAAPVASKVLATPPLKWTPWHTLSIVAVLVATGLAGWFVPSRLTAWLISMALLVALIGIVGNGVTGSWRGALIDESNKISLSRFQMLLWTILLLSAILIAILSNLKASSLVQSGTFTPNAASVSTLITVNMPSTLWALMGIATTSLVAAPLIISTKTTKAADLAELDVTKKQLTNQNVDVSKMVVNGQVISYTTNSNARWSNMFTGDETGNSANFDLGKIQMFYFTFILALVYGMALGALFASQMPMITGFPDIDPGMVTLLGISHAGYLTNKAVPHSSTPTT